MTRGQRVMLYLLTAVLGAAQYWIFSHFLRQDHAGIQRAQSGHEITDAQAGRTSMSYDKNGNRLTVTEARTNTASYAHDNMDRPATTMGDLRAIESPQREGT